MKQRELDAAVKVVHDAIAMKMREEGWGNWVDQIDKRHAELVDIVQYGLQAAEDERKLMAEEDHKAGAHKK